MSPGRPQGPRLLVVGNGMATDRLLDDLAERGALGSYDVTVVGEERHGAYDRTLLGHLLAGGEPDDIVTKPPAWYADHGVRLVTGRWVQRLDTAAREAHVGNGERLPYDLAVLATGSAPSRPRLAGIPAAGAPGPGVHVFRTIDDCLALRAAAARGRARRVVVVGAGLLGLEVATTLRELGHDVTVVHPHPTVLDAQLDDTGGAFARRAVEARGIAVVIGRAEAVLRRGGRLDALLLDDRRVLPADTLVLATGARPRVETAAASGIDVDLGVVVDGHLATSAPDVFAIGDCAEHDATVAGLVAACWDQAAVLAARLAGDPTAAYRPAPPFARLKVAGVEVTSLGEVHPDGDDEVLQTIEARRGVYRKLVIRHGRLAGAVLVGDGDSGAALIRAVQRRDELPGNRVELLCRPAAGEPGDATHLCSCHQVSEAALRQAIAAGHDTFAALQQVSRAATGCGSCAGRVRRLLRDAIGTFQPHLMQSTASGR